MNNIRNLLNDPKFAMIGMSALFLFIALRLAYVNGFFSSDSAPVKQVNTGVGKVISEASSIVRRPSGQNDIVLTKDVGHLSTDSFINLPNNPFERKGHKTTVATAVVDEEESFPLILGMIIFDRFPMAVIDNKTAKKGDVLHDRYAVIRVKSNEVVLWDNVTNQEVRVRYPENISSQSNVVTTKEINDELPNPLPSSY